MLDTQKVNIWCIWKPEYKVLDQITPIVFLVSGPSVHFALCFRLASPQGSSCGRCGRYISFADKTVRKQKTRQETPKDEANQRFWHLNLKWC